MKYVVFSGYGRDEQIIIFPDYIQHSTMATDVERSSFGRLHPISGGFIVNGECVGESESLRMKSRGELDTALIPGLLGLDDDKKAVVVAKNIQENRKAISKNKAKSLRRKGNHKAKPYSV